jgi:hypothetical protein
MCLAASVVRCQCQPSASIVTVIGWPLVGRPS